MWKLKTWRCQLPCALNDTLLTLDMAFQLAVQVQHCRLEISAINCSGFRILTTVQLCFFFLKLHCWGAFTDTLFISVWRRTLARRRDKNHAIWRNCSLPEQFHAISRNCLTQASIYRYAICDKKIFAPCSFYFPVHRTRENLRNPSTFTFIQRWKPGYSVLGCQSQFRCIQNQLPGFSFGLVS